MSSSRRTRKERVQSFVQKVQAERAAALARVVERRAARLGDVQDRRRPRSAG